MITYYPLGSKQELSAFMSYVEDNFTKTQDKNLLASSFKLILFLKLIIVNNPEIKHKKNINGAIYDSLNSLVAIFSKRERYLHLNLRSLIEHIARIALDKIDGGGDFDGSVRRKDFLNLKDQRTDENWKYMHETYIRGCHYIHASPQARLNVHATLNELISGDNTSSQSKQIALFQNVMSEVIKIFIVYYEEEISNTFLRTQNELRFILGNSLYKKFKQHQVF
ncbi:TPA: hypothetical protein ACX6PK_003395 [Photobacterium damselae]